MSTATANKLHYSPKLGRYVRCVAKIRCEYGDAHTSPLGLALAGGGEVSPHGHARILEVSPLIAGGYSVGTEKRGQTFRPDGTKLTAIEARHWRRARAKAEKLAEANREPSLLPPISWGAKAQRAVPAGRHTNPKDFELAENSTDPGILAQLSYSPDWSVRLLVTRNPATATDTLEALAVSTDEHAEKYRNEAHTELSHRYQDLRDEAELEACARMEADGALQKTLAEMPSYRQLAYMPAKRWSTKPVLARRTLVQAAMQETAKVLGVAVKFSGWTLRKLAQFTVGKDGLNLVKLPNQVPLYRSTREVVGYMVDFFTLLSGDPKSKRRLARRLGFA